MSFWNFLKSESPSGPAVSIPLTPEESRQIQGFVHRRVWLCSCGARLVIRSRDPHPDEPSNCHIRRSGHAALQPDELTWNGLAVERGWKVDPVKCPACQRGLSLAKYKDLKRSGIL